MGVLSGGAPTDISADPGASFSCFGGMILGRNIELIRNQRIVQAWRAKPWESSVYSIAKFELRRKAPELESSLTIPDFYLNNVNTLRAGGEQTIGNRYGSILRKPWRKVL